MGYTASDILGVSAGFLLYALFAFAPGYTFGWLTNVFEFRRRRLATRIAAAIPVSIGLTPITAYFLWRCWLPLVWIVFGASAVVCAILLARDARANKLHLSRAGWGVLAIAVAWLVVGTFSLVDLQIGDRLYYPVSAYDHSTRAAFTAAIARDGIPPHNPYFFAGQPAPLRYHYFWLIPSALVNLLGGPLVSARLSLIAGALWCGLGLFGVIALYLRFFQGKGGDRIERRTLIAVSLLMVTGLDIVPVLFEDLVVRAILFEMDLWNEQISSWVAVLLWIPHILASLIAGLTGFLLIWTAAGQQQRRQKIIGVVGGGLAFATCVGASIYVGITIATACALWLSIALLKRWWRYASLLSWAGVLATVLLLPFLWQVTHGVASTQPSEHYVPISLTVRRFNIPDILVDPTHQGKMLALNAALLPLNYFLEFGLYFVVGCLGVRRIRRNGLRNQAEWAAVALGTASLLLCTFTKSSVIAANDIGWRSPLVVQFILLLWAAEIWDEGVLGFGPSRTRKSDKPLRAVPWLVTTTIVLGVMGSCYELCLQRTYPIFSDLYGFRKPDWLSSDQQLGRRTFELRRAYEEIQRILPPNAVVQSAPAAVGGNLQAALYSGRQMVADVEDCGTVFGGSKQFCDDVILPHLKLLFDDRQPVTPELVSNTCHEFSITVLLFKDTDPVWKNKSSWIWTAKPLLSNDFVRVIECPNAGAQLNASTDR